MFSRLKARLTCLARGHYWWVEGHGEMHGHECGTVFCIRCGKEHGFDHPVSDHCILSDASFAWANADVWNARTPGDEAVERVAKAIANCEWDQACSALGTPNMPRGGNWTAKLPQARAAIQALSQLGNTDNG